MFKKLFDLLEELLTKISKGISQYIQKDKGGGKMEQTKVIKGILCVLFSIEKKNEGGDYTRQEAMDLLRENGIYSSSMGAQSPFVGQYGLWVEKEKSNQAEDLLF